MTLSCLEVVPVVYASDVIPQTNTSRLACILCCHTLYKVKEMIKRQKQCVLATYWRQTLPKHMGMISLMLQIVQEIIHRLMRHTSQKFPIPREMNSSDNVILQQKVVTAKFGDFCYILPYYFEASGKFTAVRRFSLSLEERFFNQMQLPLDGMKLYIV